MTRRSPDSCFHYIPITYGVILSIFFFSIHKGFSCWILEWRSYVSIIVVMSTSPLFCYSFSSIVLLIHVIKVLNIIKLYMKNPRVWIRYSHKAYTLTFILSSVCTWYLSMKSANIKLIRSTLLHITHSCSSFSIELKF